ncbi:MAG: hypothetical protein CME16_02260 [Gemmatimonadetes bacterium]|nr:hypothetical protein [Gemmatimonadota bacterium]
MRIYLNIIYSIPLCQIQPLPNKLPQDPPDVQFSIPSTNTAYNCVWQNPQKPRPTSEKFYKLILKVLLNGSNERQLQKAGNSISEKNNWSKWKKVAPNFPGTSVPKAQ